MAGFVQCVNSNLSKCLVSQYKELTPLQFSTTNLHKDEISARSYSMLHLSYIYAQSYFNVPIPREKRVWEMALDKHWIIIIDSAFLSSLLSHLLTLESICSGAPDDLLWFYLLSTNGYSGFQTHPATVPMQARRELWKSQDLKIDVHYPTWW